MKREEIIDWAVVLSAFVSVMILIGMLGYRTWAVTQRRLGERKSLAPRSTEAGQYRKGKGHEIVVPRHPLYDSEDYNGQGGTK
jgi:hypothetical protein